MVATTQLDERDTASTRDLRWRRWEPWALGVVVGLVVMGPALGTGSLLNLDLIVTPTAPVPRGVWGLGPELPRRVPMYLPAAWLSPVVPATLTIKAMMVGIVAVGFAGGWRRTESQGRLLAAGSGLLVALSPLLLTRLAIGHLMIAATMALLPWAYPALLRPGADLRRTARWCAALAFVGNYGGLVALIVIVAGLVATRGARAGKVLGLWLATQLVWLIPGLTVFGQGAGLLDATVFATRADGLQGYLRVLAGHGFWQDFYQVGDSAQTVAAVIGVVLTALAVAGQGRLPAAWRRPACWLAGVGLAVTLASTTPWVEDVWIAFTQNPVGANLRESQRLLPLFAVWVALAAPRGARRLGEAIDARWRSGIAGAAGHAVLAVPVACAALLGAPGLWGVGGQLCPIQLGEDWQAAHDAVEAEPGTVVTFPFDAYVNITACGPIRHILNPWPVYLGGDVLVSSDLGLSPDRTPTPERADPREPVVHRIDDALREEQRAPSQALAELGVRWVVFTRVGEILTYQQVLDADPGLERVSAGKDVFVYRVRDWAGVAVDAADRSRSVPLDPLVEPLATGAGATRSIWHRPFAGGWLRGLTPAGVTEDGLLEVPAGGGPVWYWPTALVLLGDLICLATVVWALRPMGPDERSLHEVG